MCSAMASSRTFGMWSARVPRTRSLSVGDDALMESMARWGHVYKKTSPRGEKVLPALFLSMYQTRSSSFSALNGLKVKEPNTAILYDIRCCGECMETLSCVKKRFDPKVYPYLSKTSWMPCVIPSGDEEDTGDHASSVSWFVSAHHDTDDLNVMHVKCQRRISQCVSLFIP